MQQFQTFLSETVLVQLQSLQGSVILFSKGRGLPSKISCSKGYFCQLEVLPVWFQFQDVLAVLDDFSQWGESVVECRYKGDAISPFISH